MTKQQTTNAHPQKTADLAVLKLLPEFRACAQSVRAGNVTQDIIDQEREQIKKIRDDAMKEADGSYRRKAYDGWIVLYERRLDRAQQELNGMKR